MLKLLLITFATVYVAHTLEVAISYDAPVLELTLPLKDDEVRGVVFYYITDGMYHQARGTKTSKGWQYITRTTISEGVDTVYSYADVYDHTGYLLRTTQKSSLSLRDNRPAVRLPSSRKIRSVLFREDFNSFNPQNWKYEVSMYGGMNWEFQVYTNDKENVFVKNSNLYLVPTRTVDDSKFDESFLHNGVMDVKKIWGYCTNAARNGCLRQGKDSLLPPVKSGKITSVPTLKYGVVEVRAKIPKGDWIWPAIWLLPKNDVYGGWPRSGEIDIMESRGNEGDIGIGSVMSTLHWGPSYDRNRYDLTTAQKKSSSWHDNFHTWRLEWTEDYIKTFIDNQLILDVERGSGFWKKGGFSGPDIWANGGKMAPFDQEFYMLLNVAVGGTNGFFKDDYNYAVQKPWKNDSPTAPEDFWKAQNAWYPTWQGDQAAMLVDYVEFRNH